MYSCMTYLDNQLLRECIWLLMCRPVKGITTLKVNCVSDSEESQPWERVIIQNALSCRSFLVRVELWNNYSSASLVCTWFSSLTIFTTYQVVPFNNDNKEPTNSSAMFRCCRQIRKNTNLQIFYNKKKTFKLYEVSFEAFQWLTCNKINDNGLRDINYDV